MFRKHKRLLLGLLLIAFLAVLVLVLASRSIVLDAARGRIFADPESSPSSEAALVLGCARTLANGRENLYFHYRIEAAVQLYLAGKIKHLIVSGDNSHEDYDEPTTMKDALVARGIPADRIHCDYAGFRTLDSVIRARDIFQQSRFIVISQEFHAQRAVYLARHHGIDAYGLAARDVTSTAGLRTRLRENLARVKAVLDTHILHTTPKFLGVPVPLGG